MNVSLPGTTHFESWLQGTSCLCPSLTRTGYHPRTQTRRTTHRFLGLPPEQTEQENEIIEGNEEEEGLRE